MRDIYRTYKHTKYFLLVVNLKSEKTEHIEYDYPSVIKDAKIEFGKLERLLEEENKKLIKIEDKKPYSISYYQKEATFKQHADYFTVDGDIIQKPKNKKQK